MGKKKSAVSNRIRELRFKNGEMTQQELATQIGVARQTIIAMEQGRFSPSLESALRLARIFNTSVDAIFTLHEAE
jgi:putative transcriptional regulator